MIARNANGNVLLLLSFIKASLLQRLRPLETKQISRCQLDKFFIVVPVNLAEKKRKPPEMGGRKQKGSGHNEGMAAREWCRTDRKAIENL